LIVTQKKVKRADRKDQGQRKQTEFIIIAKMTVARERKRERERNDNQTGKET
jgi:hypothetical protein